MIVFISVLDFVKICQVLTILHQLFRRVVANFGTRCILWCLSVHWRWWQWLAVWCRQWPVTARSAEICWWRQRAVWGRVVSMGPWTAQENFTSQWRRRRWCVLNRLFHLTLKQLLAIRLLYLYCLLLDIWLVIMSFRLDTLHPCNDIIMLWRIQNCRCYYC